MAAPDPSTAELRARYRQQEAVADLGQRALSTGDVDGLFQEAAAAVGDALDVDYCAVLELRPDAAAFRLRAGVGWQDGAVGSTTLPTGRNSQAGYTLVSETPVIVDDLPADERFSGSDLLVDHDVTSGISVVVGDVDDPWGVLGVHATEAQAFTDHDVAFVRTVANVLESAIENETARRRAETERTLVDRIVETSPVGIVHLDADGTVRFANERATDLLGRDRDGTSPLRNDCPSWRFVDASGAPIPDERMPARRVIETGDPVTDVGIGIDRPDGGRVWLSVNGSPTTDADGSTSGVVLSFEDVTERRELEARLRRKNRTLHRLHEITADRERSFDEQAADLLELGRDFLDLEVAFLANVDEEDELFEIVHAIGDDDQVRPGATAPLERTYCQRTIQSDGPVAYRDAAAEGVDVDAYENYDFDSYLGATVTVGGELYGTFCFCDDAPRDRAFAAGERAFVELVSQWLGGELERIEYERSLEQYREYTDDVLDAVDDVLYVVDDDGRLQRWNESLCTATGYAADEIETMHALDFFASDHQETIANAIQDVFETGSARVEAPFLTSDGREIPYEFVASALETPDGERVLTGIGRDVTERERNRRKLEELVAKLEESNERLEEFAYAASHDLQEPLRMVSSYLQLLEQRYGESLDEDGREFLAYAVDGADRMREMIDGLLEYSRVDTGGEPFEPVDLDDVLVSVRRDLQVRIEESDADVTVESLPTIQGDEGQLRQLFQNLLSNAVKYAGDEPPRVYVGVERGTDDEWEFSVRDEGIGISPDQQERVFEVFKRLHSVEEYSGAGIGLALCERIVERHGGDIWVDSEPDEGTTFRFVLGGVDRPTTAGVDRPTGDWSTNAAAERNEGDRR